MCGIVCVFGVVEEPAAVRARVVELAKRVRHRGPDWSGVYADSHAVLAHERLAIVDVEHGAQPLRGPDDGVVLAANGEIYNHRELRDGLSRPYPFTTESDCEVLIPLYQERGPSFLNDIDGSFAFALYEPQGGTWFVARDHVGIVPLFWGRDAKGQRYVASEMKALIGVCTEIEEFPPGHYYLSTDAEPKRYYAPEWAEEGYDAFVPHDAERLRHELDLAVTRRLMCDVPYGALISGGVDSSIVGALVARHAATRVESGGRDGAWWPRLHTFCIGLEGGPDLPHAQTVADHVGSVHHTFHYTIDDGFDALRDAIEHLETFDITTIRAGTPMYLLSRRIKSMGIKMVLSGEGADEIFAGYLYFHKAPSADELRQETLRKLFALHRYDLCRANKAMSAWGVEARVPFLAKNVLDYVMRIDPQAKMSGGGRIEKHILREAFDGFVPHSVLYRQKEQFSDGVGYSWIDSLRARADQRVSDEDMRAAKERFPIKTPLTKEGYLYRVIFDELFPGDDAAQCVGAEPSIACSSEAALAWDESFQGREDPSGRAVGGVHDDAWE